MTHIAEAATAFLQEYLTPELIVFIISLLPILELRGGLVAATLLGIPWGRATLIAMVGNILPIPFILLFIRKILELLKKVPLFRGFVRWLENKAHTKGARMMEKYPRRVQLALFLFVAIPLPGTGAWTGSLVAAFLGIAPRKALPPILLGVCGAALIMLSITYVIPSLMGIK